MDTLDAIKEVLSDNLDIDPDTITLESTMQSLDIDSLDMVEMVCDLEEKLGIDFGEPEDIDTIGAMVDYIDSL